MKAPSASRLQETFRIDSEQASLLRKLAKYVDEPETLEALIEKEVPPTAQYVRSMHSSPYGNHMWRVTVVLHAMSNVLDMSGVEGLGPTKGPSYAPPYEYLNAGDPYTTTLIYERETDTLSIGAYGDIVEEVEEGSQEDSWNDWAERDFKKALEVHLGSDALDDVDSDKLLEVFELASRKAGEYWETQSDGGMSIDIKRIVKKLSIDDIFAIARELDVMNPDLALLLEERGYEASDWPNDVPETVKAEAERGIGKGHVLSEFGWPMKNKNQKSFSF